MAEIATYRCSNYRCRLTFRLCRDFPVWSESAPKKGRTITPTASFLTFVERYRSELYCHSCKRVIEDAHEITECTFCGNAELHSEQAGKPCAQCTNGKIELLSLSVR